jgi:protein ImuB
VRLKNFPVDRLRRGLHKEQLRKAATEASSEFVVPAVRRIHGRPTTGPPRQRRWNHQLWAQGPRDANVTSTGRAKLFMPTRGACMTPDFRPVQKPSPVQTSDDPPLAIVRTVATRQEIVAVASAALHLGVRPGLTLTEGRALCGGLIAFDHDPTRDARALEALARWMFRFTPRVSLGTQDSALSTIFLDLTGCDRAFGGISNIVRDVIHSLGRLRLSASVAVAPTPGAAWAFASFGENGRIISFDDLATELFPLPVAALRLEDELLESLHHLGLETIGQVMNLPRSALPSRFGPMLLLRLNQALGVIDEPLVPLEWHAPIDARIDFDGAVDSLEAIWLTFRRLIDQIVTQLTRRGCGARRIEVEFFRPYAQTIRHTIALSRPSRDPVNLFNLLRCATENLIGGDDGFVGVRLVVPLAERISDEQIALLDQERYAGEIELAQLIERLSVRLGEAGIAQPTLVESHVPERAFSWHGLSTHDSNAKTRVENPCHQRPLQLLCDPIEIGVMVSPSDDRDGRPILFRLRDDVHELRHVLGPERISGEWWRGHFKTRDYFDVEDDQGRRFWVFRVNETGRWFLHGTFA